MGWTYVSRDVDSAEFLRDESLPLTSPRYDDLDSRQKRQAMAAHKVIRGLVKAGVVGEGKIRVNAAGHRHHENRMPADPSSADFIAINIGRVP